MLDSSGHSSINALTVDDLDGSDYDDDREGGPKQFIKSPNGANRKRPTETDSCAVVTTVHNSSHDMNLVANSFRRKIDHYYQFNPNYGGSGLVKVRGDGGVAPNDSISARTEEGAFIADVSTDRNGGGRSTKGNRFTRSHF